MAPIESPTNRAGLEIKRAFAAWVSINADYRKIIGPPGNHSRLKIEAAGLMGAPVRSGRRTIGAVSLPISSAMGRIGSGRAERERTSTAQVPIAVSLGQIEEHREEPT